MNDVFIDMAVDAGVDSGIVDPVGSDAARVFSRDRSSHAYRLGAALLSGEDPYGIEFLSAFRAGVLGGEG